MLKALTARCVALSLALSAGLALPASADEVDTLIGQLEALNLEGRYAEAAAIGQSAADQARSLHGETSQQFARVLSWQAYLLQVRGRWEQAETLFEKSLSIYEKVLPSGHPDIATSINNLGFSYQNSDRLVEAEQMYKRALDMREKASPPNPGHIADSLNNLAQCYKRQGRYAEAEPLHRRALAERIKLLRSDHPLIAQSLVNLGSTLELQERFADAEPHYRKALEIRRAGQPADHPDVAGALTKIGELLMKQGRFVEADRYLREAVEIRYRSQPAGHIDIATSLAARAQNLIALGRVDEAKSALRTALAIQQIMLPPLHPSIAASHAELGRIARLEGDPRQALSLLRVAAVSQAARGRQDDLSRQHFARLVDAAFDVWSKAVPGDQRLADEALEMAQRSAQTETAATISRMAARFASNDPELRKKMRIRQDLDVELASGEAELSALLALPVEERAQPIEVIKTRLDDLIRRQAGLDTEIRKAFPSYAQLVSPEPLSVAQVRDLLEPDEALVHYFCGIDGVYMWAVTTTAVKWLRLETDLGTLRDVVSSLRASLDVSKLSAGGTNARLFSLGDAHRLYRWLIAPAAGLIEGKRELIFSMCGPLTSLPPQTLVKSLPKIERPGLHQISAYQDADWLLNHHAMSVIPSLTSLRAIRTTARRPDSSQPLVGFGNPLFRTSLEPPPAPTPPAPPAQSGRPPGGYSAYWRGPAVDAQALRSGLAELPDTETELKLIAETLKAPAAALRLGRVATEAAVKTTDLSNYKVVYFATHGLVAGELRGLGEPALALTLPATPSELDDGLLTATEVSQLRLNADWVVLSACNTADGSTVGAEALSGLAKSFFNAGARSLLVSHWRVGSQSTMRMTTTLFDALKGPSAISKSEALRRAMRTMLADKSDPWNAYPTFWAPFVIVGDNRS